MKVFVKSFFFSLQVSVKLLARIADTSKDGLISFSEFQAFEGLLCTPDALYKIAFQLFDRKGTGLISYGNKIFFIIINFLVYEFI